MSKPAGGQTTKCARCEESRVIYPPSPMYPVMLLHPCPEGDSIKKGFECAKCGEINRRYWDRRHREFQLYVQEQNEKQLRRIY